MRSRRAPVRLLTLLRRSSSSLTAWHAGSRARHVRGLPRDTPPLELRLDGAASVGWRTDGQSDVLQESYRVTHNRDIVPSVPIQLMGFHHVPREVRPWGHVSKCSVDGAIEHTLCQLA